MNMLLIFWIGHEGCVLFLRENVPDETVKQLEAIIEMSDEREKAREAKKMLSACYDSTEWKYQPSDTRLAGDVCLINLYPASSLL